MSYWKANKPAEEKLREAFSRWIEILAEARSLCDQIGAKNFLFSTGFFSMRISGFEFEHAPDKTMFKPMRKHPKGWVPKVKNPLFKEMQKMETDCIKKAKEVLGIGDTLETPGIKFTEKCVLIEWFNTLSRQCPVSCTRISDIEYERLINE